MEILNNPLPKYSVCICNYNMADTIETSLTSVLNQLDSNYEVLVVDDGSNDSSTEIIKGLQMEYTNLRLIELSRDKNRELGLTRNISIQEAKGEYILLHIDTDDYWEPYITSFVYLFHKLEKIVKKDFLLSGNQINIGKKSFLIKHGPYRNTHRAQDRDMWHRLAAINAYIPVDHIPFRKRLSRPLHIKNYRIFRNTWFQLIYDLRQGTRTYQYVFACFTSFFRKNKKLSLSLKIVRLILIIPAFIRAKFYEPLPMPKSLPTHKEFVLYREKNRGTFKDLFKRYGSSYDLFDMNLDEQYIFNNRG